MKRPGNLRRKAQWPSRRNKFNAKPVHNLETGESYDSKGEARYIGYLKIRQMAGEISDLQQHPKIVLIPKRGKAPEIAWKVDASYTEDGRTIWSDFKPRPATPRENLLFKLWAHYGPGLLLIVGDRGKELKRVMPEKGGEG